ncbi:MAG TPA: FtsX-like permease family protein, partial [Acidimicrobiales bacterium]|nr:FtsX-like permease family protein [Acidimicrobiales bacterium]
MIRLSARLGIGGGTEPVVRQVVTALGVALGVAILLFAGVAFPALHAHDVRGGWLYTRAQNSQPAQDEATTDPLLWRHVQDRFEGQPIERVDVAALGARAPLPPGLDRLPGPGEYAASPALERLMERTPATELGDRFPGQLVATVGHDALQSPDDLVVIVGDTPAELQGDPRVQTVHSIEAKPVSHSETRLARVAIFLGGIGIFVQIIVFVATATRLAAARREQRLAALRLAGATPAQTNLVAAVEAAIAAVAGVAIGFVLFLVLRPVVARIPFDGKTFYPSDLQLPVTTALAVAIGVPIIAMLAAVVTLRRVRVSPLGVSRITPPSQPHSRRLLILALGLALFFVTLLWVNGQRNGGETPIYALAGAFAVILLGVFAAGPWVTALVARLLGRFGRTPATLVASRRLQDNPKVAFRAIGGLTLAVFLATTFSGIAASALASKGQRRGPDFFPPDMLTASPGDLGPNGVLPATSNPMLQQLAATPGVGSVVDVRALPPDVTVTNDDGPLLKDGARVRPGLVRCRDAAVVGLAPCDGTVAIAPQLGKTGLTTYTLSRPVADSELDGLPLIALAVGTDGRSTTIERARTLIVQAAPGAMPTTEAEDEADNAQEIHTIERMSDAALGIVLVIAGCSLAVAVAGGLVERKRPFALLRLSGMRVADLRRIVLTEAGGPLLIVAFASALVGMVVAAMVLAVVGDRPWRLPSLGYWSALTGGLVLAMAIVAST